MSDSQTYEVDDITPEQVMENLETGADYIIWGEAIDQEKIIGIRPEIESKIFEEAGREYYTKLFWNMKPNGTFYFQIHFFEDDPDEAYVSN